ncbi:MAG: inositol monophosphatase [bacterium]
MEKFLQDIIKEAGFLAKGYYQQEISHTFKSDPTDILTVADTAVESFLINKILERYPDHGIISEEREDPINPEAEYVWVIDPIDGTRNFSRHIAMWCTMVGITKKGKPYMGAVYDAVNDELFFAKKGKGAFLNNNKIHVSKHADVKHSFLVFSGGVMNQDSPYNAGEFERYAKFHDKLVAEDGHWIHNFGTTMSLCALAAGRVDAMIMNSGLYHDYLANYVIATEAGALFTDSHGNDWKKGRMDVVVANSTLHKNLMAMFN